MFSVLNGALIRSAGIDQCELWFVNTHWPRGLVLSTGHHSTRIASNFSVICVSLQKFAKPCKRLDSADFAEFASILGAVRPVIQSARGEYGAFWSQRACEKA